MQARQCFVTLCIVGLSACGGRSTPLTPSPPAVTPGTPAATCSFTLDVSLGSFDAAGGQASATVTTEAGCRWTLDVDANGWIRPGSGEPFAGPSTFTIAVEPNRSFSSRSATVGVKDQAGRTVAGRALTQRGAGCLYSVDPTARAFDAIGTFYPGEPPVPVGIRVHAQPAECRWTVESVPSWVPLHFSSPRGGTGDGVIYVVVMPNTSGSHRSGDVVVAGLSGVNPDARFTVVQAPR